MTTINLSHFQKEKLEYYFKFFEPNADGCLDDTSLARFMQRVLAFTKWSSDDIKVRHFEEIHEAFFEVLFERSGGGKQHKVSLDDWLTLWSKMLPGCMGIMNFPVWLRLLPKTLFQMMDRDNDGLLNRGELTEFYREMINIPDNVVEERAQAAYDQMTDYGRWPLNLESYEQIFSNFLIGRTAYGPGRHIFGCFEHSFSSFSLLDNIPDDDDSRASLQAVLQDRTPQAGVPYSKPKPKRHNSFGNAFSRN